MTFTLKIKMSGLIAFVPIKDGEVLYKVTDTTSRTTSGHCS